MWWDEEDEEQNVLLGLEEGEGREKIGLLVLTNFWDVLEKLTRDTDVP